MVGMQNQRDVERALGSVRRRRAVEHKQEICRVRQVSVRFYDFFPLPDPVIGRHDHRDLRGQTDGLMNVGVVIASLKLRIVERERGHSRTQYIHGERVFRGNPQQVQDRSVQLALFRQPLPNFFQLVALGQTSKPQQVAGLFKIRVVGQVVNIDPAIRQYALLAVDVANAGSGGNDAFKALRARSWWLGWTCFLATARMFSLLAPRQTTSPQPLVIRQNPSLSNR